MGYQLIGAAGRPRVQGGAATYPGALPGVDVVQTALADVAKEDLVLRSAAAASSFTYRLGVPVGATAVLGPDGAVRVATGAGPVLWFPAPTVADAAGAPAGPGVARFTLSGSAGAGYLLGLGVDPGWLAAPGRVFPVTVDPTAVPVNAASGSYLYSGAAGTNYTGAGVYKVGVDAGGVYRTVLQFDTSSVPRDADVISSSLQATLASNSTGTPVTLGAYRLTQPWAASGVSWASASSGTAWTSPGGTRVAGPEDTTTVGTAAGENEEFVLSATIGGWVNGTVANDGVELAEVSPETTSSVVSLQTGAQVPYLTVNYVARLGSAPQLSYYQHRLSDRSTLAVNRATGNLMLSTSAVHLAGTGIDLSIGPTYNSRADTPVVATTLGTKWTLGLSRDVHLDDYYDGHLLTTGDGGRYWFLKNPDGSYTGPAGFGATMSKDPQTGYHVVTVHQTGVRYTFGYYGLLYSVADRNGDTITLNYSQPLAAGSTVTSITDTRSRSVVFGYTSGRLSTLTDNTARSFGYGYDSTGTYLTSYTDPAGNVTGYSYNPAGLLTQVRTATGETATISYDSAARVTAVSYALTGTTSTNPVTFGYTAGPVSYTLNGVTTTYPGKTDITDANGHTSHVYLDAASRVPLVVDPLGHAQSRGYDTNNNVTSLTDALSAVTQLSYDPNNNPTRAQAPSPGGGVANRSQTLDYATPSTVSGYQYLPSGRTDARSTTRPATATPRPGTWPASPRRSRGAASRWSTATRATRGSAAAGPPGSCAPASTGGGTPPATPTTATARC